MTAIAGTAPPHLRGRARRYPQGMPGKRARAARARAGPHRRLRLREVLPDRARHRALRRSRRASCARAAARRPTAVCYCLGVTAVDPARIAPAVRALHQPRAQASRPTSTSTSSTSGARRSSSTSTRSTAATAPRWPRSSSATAAQRAARGRQGAGHRRAAGGRLRQGPLWFDERDCARGKLRGMARPSACRRAGPGRCAVAGAVRGADGLPAPPLASTWAASCSRGPAHAPGAGRERGDGGPHRDPVGQGRPRRRWACSRSTCWRWAC